MKKGESSIHTPRMRLAATLALVPLTVGIEMVMIYFLDFYPSGWPQRLSKDVIHLLMTVMPLFVLYGGIFLIWGPAIQWNRQRVLRMVYMNFGFVLFAVFCGIAGLLDSMMAGLWGFTSASLAGAAIGLFLLGHIWWALPNLRNAGGAVPCSKCGYDLRGQRECRCPECGTAFTLGEIASTLALPAADPD